MIFKAYLRLATVLVHSTVFVMAGGAYAESPSIRIGAPLPLTGPLSPEGTKLKQGYDLWVQEVNAAGGISVGIDKRRVELVYYDYESNTPKSVQLAEKLVNDDKVDFMFAPFGSGSTKAASSVAEKYGIPMIASTASSVEVYDQGYKNLFGVFTANDTLTEPIADLVSKKFQNIKKVAILARNDLYPLALAQDFSKSAIKRGLEVVVFEKYAIGALDHASALTQMRAARPDWIIATGYVNDLILIRKQMADISLRAPLITMINGPAYKEFTDAVGPLSENVTSAAWWHPAAKYKGDDVFKSGENYTKLFIEKYKSDPDFTTAGGSVIGVVLQMAIEKAGTLDRAKVREVLASSKFETFFGPIAFNSVGQATSYTPPIFQIRGQKSFVVHPPEIASGELQLK
jgi:branched-chain amino acid transport system substrate-binding protein